MEAGGGAGQASQTLRCDGFLSGRRMAFHKQQKQRVLKSGIRLEFDTGLRRCGLTLDAKSVEIAQMVFALPNLRWEGISLYPGHIMGNRKIREQDIPIENGKLDRLFALLDSAGISYPVAAEATRPLLFRVTSFHGVAEIRPGTYVWR